MTPEWWRQLETIFHDAAELEAAERTLYLNLSCGDDQLLRAEVESLLASREKPVSIIDRPPDREALRLLAVDQGESIVGRSIDHYEVLAPLGAGGMGEVYLAQDKRLGRKVALKLLAAVFNEDADQVRRFQQEARAASALNHPNIITIHEIGKTNSLHYIATEFIQGETLRQQIHGACLSVGEAIDIARQVASALAAAHHVGIVHRDIKPENVMLRDDGYVKVLDFGIALLTEQQAASCADELPATSAGPTATSARLTGSRPAAGTFGYMSPEQARGEQLDARTDLFSLGVMLYEMLTGRRPFEGHDHAAVLHALLENEPPPLSALREHVPRALEEIVGKAQRKNRDERYQSAGELLDDLRGLKRQLEARTTSEEPVYAPASTHVQTAATAAAATEQLETVSARTLANAMRRYANWILFAGVLAALAAFANGLLHPSSSLQVFNNLLLLLLTAVCALVFFYARRQTAYAVVAVDCGGAFRGLVPFQEADRDRFYGREPDTASLFAMLARSRFRFGVLYGDSGSGKTSLLTAGLMPRLKAHGYAPVYCRPYRDPLAALLEECRKRTEIRRRDDEPSLDYLRRVGAALGKELVLIFDQFEEFFVHIRARREREPFASFVAACYGADDLPVKLLFSIRSDFLYLISSEFDGRIPEPLMGNKRYHLRNLDEEQAERIIAQSARGAGLPLEGALCRQVARELAAGGSVLPSELQIVGAQLQARRIYTLAEYRRAGGKEQLVYNFLADVLRAADDQYAARLLLRSLISEENRRLTLSAREITRRTQRSPDTVARLLKLFVESRLVREIQDEDLSRYELMHEYLIGQINQQTGKVLDAAQRANRLFRQYLTDYALDKSTCIPLTQLWFIRRHAKVERGGRERELLKKSLRWGLLKASALIILLVVGSVIAAAALSISDEWDDVRLSDGHTAAVRRAVFSPDGRLLVSVGEDAKIIIWDFARRVRLATLTDHTAAIRALAFSPDGKWFATGDEDRTVIVWNAVRWEKAATLRDHLRIVGGLAFSPDARLLASTSSEPPVGRTILWAVGRWEKLRDWPRGGEYGALSFTSDGRRLILSSHDLIWDLDTGRQIEDSFQDWGGNWAAISPDGTRLVGTDGGGGVTFSDLPRRKVLTRSIVHQDNGRAVAYSPDGSLVASGAEDIVLWDAATQTKLARLSHTAIVWSLAFSPDGRWLVSTHGDGALLLWDVAERRRVADFNEHGAAVRAVAYSHDGKRIASAGEDCSIIIWDAVSGRKESVLLGHDTRVTAVAFSPDGTWLASCDQDAEANVWDVAQQQPRFTVKGNGSSQALAISPDGRWLVTSRGAYESTNSHEVVDFFHSSGDVGLAYGLAFSADGRWLSSVTDAGYISLWESGTWRLLDRARVAGTSLSSVSFSPDGRWLATGEDQGAVRLWAVNPLREVAVLGRHAARIKSVAFSPDSRQVASAGDDKVIALWNIQRSRLVTHIGTHTAPVLSVAFSPNGCHLVAGEHDRSVHVYTRHRTLWGHRFD